MTSKEKHICPVCGYPELSELPNSLTRGASYEICESCGFQFGFDDDSEGWTFEGWRKEWIKRGMKWSSSNPPPTTWDPEKQLLNIGIKLDKYVFL